MRAVAGAGSRLIGKCVYAVRQNTILLRLCLEAGSNASDVRMAAPGTVTACLPDAAIRKLPYDQKPYWDVERARAGDTRKVPVEIVVNGKAAARQVLAADGQVRELKSQVPVSEGS